MRADGKAALRVCTNAEPVVLDDGARAWRAVVRLSEPPSWREDVLTSRATYPTERAALDEARDRARDIVRRMESFGAFALCSACQHRAHLDGPCGCGCSGKRRAEGATS